MTLTLVVQKRLLRIQAQSRGGYRYRKGRKLRRDWRRLKCILPSCRGRAIRKRGRVFLTHEHNHRMRPEYEIMDRFEASLLRKSVNCWAKPMKIYEDTITIHEDARRWCPFPDFHSKISRWQANDVFLPVLNSFRQFEDEVTARSTLREYKGGNLEVSMIPLQGGQEIGIIGDRGIVQPIVEETLELRITIEKSMRPRDLEMEETVAFSVVYAKAVLTVVWAFLPNSQPITYELLVIRVKNQFLRDLRFTRITTTFDGGLYNALQRCFPNVRLHVSLSDHAKELVLASNRLGIDTQDEAVQIIITKLIGASASQDIIESFGALASILTHDMLQNIGRLFDYYQDSWINGVTCEVFNFYRDEQSLMEPNKSPWFLLRGHLRHSNYGMWAWMKGLIHFHEQTYVDLQKLLRQRRYTVTPHLKSIISPQSLTAAWNARENFNDYNALEFLATMSTLIADMVANIIHQHAGEVDHIELIQGNNPQNHQIIFAPADHPDQVQLLRQIPLHEINGRNFDRPRRDIDLDDTWSLPGSDQELNSDDEFDIAAQAAELPVNPDGQWARRGIQGRQRARGRIQDGDEAGGEVQVGVEARGVVQGEVEAAGEVQAGEEVEGEVQGVEEAEPVVAENGGAVDNAPVPAQVVEGPINVEVEENGIPVPRYDTECMICRDRQIDSVFVTCGHVACNRCASEVRVHALNSRNRFRCPYCNQRVQNVINFFIPVME